MWRVGKMRAQSMQHALRHADMLGPRRHGELTKLHKTATLRPRRRGARSCRGRSYHYVCIHARTCHCCSSSKKSSWGRILRSAHCRRTSAHVAMLLARVSPSSSQPPRLGAHTMAWCAAQPWEVQNREHSWYRARPGASSWYRLLRSICTQGEWVGGVGGSSPAHRPRAQPLACWKRMRALCSPA